MQGNLRRSQSERREQTQRALVSAARALFAEKGFAGTSTPEIVTAAGVTRGALYHHFADKLALFEAVVEEEHLLVSMSINAAESDEEPGPIKALLAGCDAFLNAMQDSGRRQIMLIDAPAVLGRAKVDEIDARHGMETLVCGLRDAMDAGALRKVPVEALAQLFGAMFDRAALAAPEDVADYRKSIKALIRGLKA
ncbi:TetR family transcriptional regulator [Devosia psychrophila]|uniref:TetR family transcriptional regulator n=1 Tax=Devosia psychrophila TaxID=728005 RepID=A0A0F5PT99_9HYPH|nr:TetR family transcriptional regulator [Devosia psychrophila]SFB99943.1 transcriptional regulator, TetR family [Devosia psychrophila]